MSLIDPGPRSATVRAVTDTECIMTNYEEFSDSIQTRPRARRALHEDAGAPPPADEREDGGDGPGKRGLRERFHEWQKTMQPTPGIRRQ